MSFRTTILGFDLLAADPGAPFEGQVWYNTTDQELKVRLSGSTYALAVGWKAAANVVSLDVITDTVAIGANAMLGAEKVRVVGDLRVEGTATVTGLGVAKQASVPGGAPAAGYGTVWERSADDRLIFTDESPADNVLAYLSDIPAGAGLWSQTGAAIHQTTLTDPVVVGATAVVGSELLRVVGDARIEGKLTVTGLIDPTGLVLAGQLAAPMVPAVSEGLLWVDRSGAPTFPTFLRYTDDAGKSHYPCNPVRVVTVAPAGADYTSIGAAITAITSAGPAAPYAVLVYPGIYTEAPITLKQYVAVQAVANNSALVIASDPNNPLFTFISYTGLVGINILVGPANSAACHIPAGALNAGIQEVIFSSGQTAIRATGAGARVIAESCKMYPSVTNGLVADTGGRIDCSNILCQASGDAFRADGANSTIWLHNSGCVGATNGLHVLNAAEIRAFGVTLESCTYGLHVENANSLIQGNSVSVFGATTYDAWLQHVGGKISVTGARLDADKLLVVDWAGFDMVFADTVEVNEEFEVHMNLAVGSPEAGDPSYLGRGAPYTRGEIVITTDATAGPASDGGNLTDVSVAARSPSGSTFTFQGTAANHAIMWGSSLDDGTGTIKSWGIWVNQTIAAVGGTFVWERWSGAAWVPFDVMSCDAATPYTSYANNVFRRAPSREDIRLGLTSSSTWARKTILGRNLYWFRVRITSAVGTLPVFEQTKLLPSHLHVGADGTSTLFGNARQERDLLWHQALQDDLSGASPSDVAINFASGIVLTPVDNSFNNGVVDGVGETLAVPLGLDTSLPLTLEIVWIPSVNTAGAVEIESRHAVIPAVGSLLNASIASTLLSQITAVPVGNQDVTFRTQIRFLIPNAVPGDLLALSYFRDATGGNIDDTLNGNVEIAFTRLYGTFWR